MSRRSWWWEALRDHLLVWGGSLLLILALWAGWFYLNPRRPHLPDRAPPFQLASLDGDLVSLAAFRGRTVVLNFWAHWCGPCLQEIPTLKRFAREHPEVVVLGIATEGTAAQLRHVRARFGIDYPILRADKRTLRAYQVDTLPTTVIVGPAGDVLGAYEGRMYGWQLALATRGAR